MTRATAIVADDEPLMREALTALLAREWSDLEIVGQARNGLEALALVESHRPQICFLDIQMPGLSGIDVARQIGARAQIVFVTAFDHYALQAFEHGALDYLVKPLQPTRLAATVARLQERLRRSPPVALPESLLAELANHFAARAPTSGHLNWIRAAAGESVHLIPVEDIDYLKSDTKYTVVAWRADGRRPAEALVRTPLKTLLERLDPARFQQIHRSVVVNLEAVSHVIRAGNETADLFLKSRPETLPVSRAFLHLFKPE